MRYKDQQSKELREQQAATDNMLTQMLIEDVSFGQSEKDTADYDFRKRRQELDIAGTFLSVPTGQFEVHGPYQWRPLLHPFHYLRPRLRYDQALDETFQDFDVLNDDTNERMAKFIIDRGFKMRRYRRMNSQELIDNWYRLGIGTYNEQTCLAQDYCFWHFRTNDLADRGHVFVQMLGADNALAGYGTPRIFAVVGLAGITDYNHVRFGPHQLPAWEVGNPLYWTSYTGNQKAHPNRNRVSIGWCGLVADFGLERKTRDVFSIESYDQLYYEVNKERLGRDTILVDPKNDQVYCPVTGLSFKVMPVPVED